MQVGVAQSEMKYANGRTSGHKTIVCSFL